MRLIVAIFITLLVVGCSKVKLGYQMAPRVLINRIDDAFDFNSDRFNKIRLQLENDFKANRKDAVATLTKNIDDVLALSAQKTVTKADIKNLFDSFQKTQRSLVTYLTPTIEQTLKDLSTEEFQHLKKHSYEKFDEADKKILKKEDFLEKQTSSFEDTLEFFFDSATKEQLGIYRKFAEANYDYFVYQIEVRRNFMKTFEARLSDKKDLLDYTLKYYSGDPSIRSPEYQSKYLAFMDNVISLQFEIWQTTTEKQRNYFQETLRAIKKDLSELND